MFTEILKIKPNLERGDTTQKKIKDKKSLTAFIETHCKARKYMFSILKCNKPECNVCAPPRLPLEVFQQLSHLPDPIPDEGDHYKPFSEIYGHLTTEHYMPSKKETQVASSNSTGSCPMTAQYAKDTVTCTECFKPRVIYRKKLSSPIGLCGAVFQKLIIIENIGCNSPIEIPY